MRFKYFLFEILTIHQKENLNLMLRLLKRNDKIDQVGVSL